MSIQRIGGGYTPPDLFAETKTQAGAGADADAAQQQAELATPHRRHHTLSRARRQAVRKRRSAESPDANDPAAESEELLMMLDQHLRRDQTAVLKVDARDARGGQQSFDQDEHSAGAQASSARASGDDHGNLPARELPMRLATRDARDESALSKHWRAAVKDGAASVCTPAAQAEAALVGLHTARARRAAGVTASSISGRAFTHDAASRMQFASPAANDATQGSSTYQVLAIVREFLRMPADSRTSRATLADVRDRLVAATIQSAGDKHGGSQRGAARRPLTPAEESLNLLLPIALLNLGRGRTSAGRARGMSALAALIRRGRGW